MTSLIRVKRKRTSWSTLTRHVVTGTTSRRRTARRRSTWGTTTRPASPARRLGQQQVLAARRCSRRRTCLCRSSSTTSAHTRPSTPPTHNHRLPLQYRRVYRTPWPDSLYNAASFVTAGTVRIEAYRLEYRQQLFSTCLHQGHQFRPHLHTLGRGD